MHSKNKMLVFHQSGAIGGAGLSLLHIVDNIELEKYDISVVCPNKPHDMVDELSKRNITVIPTESTPVIFPHYNGGIKHFFSIRTIMNLLQINRDKKNVKHIIKEVNPDVVVVNSMTMFFIGKYAKAMGKKTVCFHRETYQKGMFGFRTSCIKKGLSKYFDKVVFISQFDCAVTVPCNAQKHVIYDKVDMSLYQYEHNLRETYGIKEDEKTVLYLGGISKLKGAHILLSAMNHIQSDRVRLLFVGNISKEQLDSPMTVKEFLLGKGRVESRSMIKMAYKEVKAKDKVTILPTTFEPEKYFSIADFVVFPSTMAHQARPIYEAGAAKVPIIVSDYIETTEFAQNDRNVLTFSPGNVKELAMKIDCLIGDEDKCKQLTDANYKMTLENHNLEDMKAELENVFEDFLNEDIVG